MNIFRKKYVAFPFVGAGVALIVDWTLVYAAVLPLATRARDTIVIHFSDYRGIDLVGSSQIIVGVMAVGTAIVIFNAALADIFMPRQPFFAYIFGYSSIIISFLLLLFIAVTLSVN